MENKHRFIRIQLTPAMQSKVLLSGLNALGVMETHSTTMILTMRPDAFSRFYAAVAKACPDVTLSPKSLKFEEIDISKEPVRIRIRGIGNYDENAS